MWQVLEGMVGETPAPQTTNLLRSELHRDPHAYNKDLLDF